MKKSILAFTMIELAIVLVIVAILIGAIIGGQNMLKTANLNSVITNFTNYKSAYDKFVEEYNAVPGDMIEANDVFSPQPGALTVTYSGNGNSIILDDADPARNETYLFWQHLALAGLIEGEFIVKNDGSGGADTLTVGVNVPKGSHTGAFYYVSHVGTDDDYAGICDTDGNAIAYFKGDSLAGALNPSDAFQIDSKMDDGIFNTGKVCARDSGSCIAGGATYNTAVNNSECSVIYRIDNN